MGDLSANFSRYEFACKCGCGFDTVDHQLIEKGQELADTALKTYPSGSRLIVHVISGNRCKKHNKDSGGEDDSKHLYAKAMDAVFEIIKPDGQRVLVPLPLILSIVNRKWRGIYGFAMYPQGRFHFDVADRYWRDDYRISREDNDS